MPQVAPGLPDPAEYGSVGELKPGALVPLFTQQHDARRAGPHLDLRLGNLKEQLLSWAVPKGMPQPGEKRLAIPQPLHEEAYGPWSGTIPAGTYGAGKVESKVRGKALVTNVDDDGVSFVTAHTRYPERFRLQQTPRGWILINATKTETRLPYEKVHFQQVDEDAVDKLFTPKNLVTAKIDGSSLMYELLGDKIEALSLRTGKATGRPIVHTERIGSPRLREKLKDTVLRGEMYGVRDNQAIPAAELGGLLNSTIELSLARQKERDIELKHAVFDILKHEGKDVRKLPYAERLKLLRGVLEKLPEQFHLPEGYTDPAQQRELWNRIRTGKDPLTREGIVAHPLLAAGAVPIKAKTYPESDVIIKGIVPGKGRLKGMASGGFWYSLTPEGPIVGKVGCVALGTTISAGNGLQPIEQVRENWQVWSHDEKGAGSLQAVSHLHLPRDVVGLQVVVEGGLKLTGSRNHPVLCSGFEFKTLEELTTQDYVAIVGPYIGETEVMVGDLRISEMLGYVLGLWLAEGCFKSSNLKHNSVTFSLCAKSDEPLRQIICRYFTESFPARSVSLRRNGTVVEVTSEAFAWLLGRLGLRGKTAAHKFIPRELWASRKILCAVLRGLFDGDGGCLFAPAQYTYGPYFTSASEKLAEDVLYALLGLGISATIYNEENTGLLPSGKVCEGTKNTVRIMGREGVARYAEIVGFVSQDKAARLQAALQREGRKSGNDTIPLSFSLIEPLFAAAGIAYTALGLQLGVGLSSWKKTGHVSRGVLRSVLEGLTKRGADVSPLERYLRVWWRRVKAMHSVETTVVDITVPGTHTYWSAGFISHNTGLSDEDRWDMWQNPNEWVGRTARIRAQEQFPSGAYRAPAFLARHEDVTQKTALDFYHAIYGDDADEKLKAILESGVLKPGGEVAGTEKKYEKRAPKYRRDDTAVYLSPQLLKDDARYHFKIPAERVKNPEFELKRRIITLEKLLELQAKTDLQKIYDETTPPRRHRNIPQVMARQRIPVTAADVVEGIAFPKEELAALTERLAGGKTIGTTRISDERGKYKVGDVLPSELGQLRVRSVISGSDLPEHPYLAELTDEQKTILTGQPFDYVELEPAKAEDVTQKTAGLSREDIIAQLKTYGHPRMGISVGAAMTLRGLRDSTADIDAEAPPEVFGELHKKHGSPALSKSKLGDRVYRIPGSDIDLYESWDEGYEALPEVNALVATKPALLAFYRKLNRPKDQPWIQALEQEQKEATVQPRLMVMAALLKQAAAPAKMMAPAAGSDRVSRLLAGVRQGHPAVPGVPDLQSQAREQLWSRGLVRRAQGQQPAFGQGRQQQPPQPVKPLQQPVPATPGKMMAPAAGADRVSRYMADFAVTHPPIPGGEAIRMDIARSQLRSQNFDRRSQPWLQQQPRQLQPRRPTNIGMVDAPTPASPVSPQVPQKVAADDAPRWGWLAVRLPPALQSKVRRLVSRIDRHDLAEGGKELEPHITVAYGLEATERDKPIIRQELENFKAPAITIGGASVFENQGYKVLKLDIDSPELHRLRQHIAGKYPMPGNTYTEYHPHITLAYLKPEVDESKYLDNDLVGQQFKGGRWVFRGKREQEKVAMSTPQELRQRLQKAAAEVEEDLGANAVFRIKWPSDRHPGRFEHLKLGPDVTSGMEATLAAPTTVMGTVTVPRVKIPDYEATRLGWQAARGMAADVAPPLIALAALLGVGGIGGVAYWHHRKNRKRQQDESLRKKQQQEKTAVTKSRELKQRLQKAAAEVAQTQEEEAKKRKGPTFGQKLLRGGLATAAGGMAGLIGGGYGGFKLGQHASNRLQDSALRELRADHQASRSGLSSLWMPPLSEENLKAIAGAATENDRAELEGTGALGGAALGAGGGALLGLALYLAFRRTGG